MSTSNPNHISDALSGWKGSLDNLVTKLKVDGVEDTPYNDKEWK